MNYFQRKPGMKIVMARVFNLDGDGISPLLFPGRVRTEIKNYLAKKTMSIQVGDLSAWRDYLPVDDAVLDLITIMEHGKAGEVYNVGSGHPVNLKGYLEDLLKSHNINMEAVTADDLFATKCNRVSVVAADLSKISKLKANQKHRQ